ncbi:MAG: dihydrolipoamide acetyltransferase family protein [Candidatus Binatus sp.]|uniref:dihydrolipoamide acetyltransferase family protein n=1 Tax=Candidatus Binatus sp. TaxID=2811406 RepID=UPI003D0E3262
MAVEVTMPKFGLTMREGTIQRFFKAQGDRVNAGEPLYEVETEKVLYQVEAPASGTLAIAMFDEGATVECGTAIAVIAEAGEDVATVAARYSKSAPAHRASPATSPPATNQTAAVNPSQTAAPNASGRDRKTVSPVARKLASELGVDLDKIEGSGPGGRITREDVERAAKSAPAPSAGSAPSADRVAFRGVRKVIAERMHQSLRSSAQITITAEADVTPATELRARRSREFDFSYTDMMIHSVARALMRHPRMNARLNESGNDTEIVLCANANVGIAVALDEGLIVPVVNRAESKPLREIAVESRALGEKARAGQLKLEDVTGGTFTISNLGMFGIDAFTPILNPGETGILGVGRIVEKPAVYRGEIAKRAMLWLSLTFDHRVLDGAPAAQFLQSVIELFNYGA